MKKIALLVSTITLIVGLCACTISKVEDSDSGISQVPSWQEQYDLGVRCLSEGNYQEAIIAFTAAIEINMNLTNAYVGRGDAYVGIATLSFAESNVMTEEAESYYQDALDDYLAAIELDNSNVDIYLKAADVYIALGDVDRANEILHWGFEITGSDVLSRRMEEATSEANEEVTSGAEPSGDRIPIEVTGSIPLSNVSYSYKEGGQLSENFADLGAIGELSLFYTVDGPPDVAAVGIFVWDDHGSYNSENAGVILNSAIELWKKTRSTAMREVPFRVNGAYCPVFPDQKGTLQDIFLVGYNEQIQAMGYAIVTVEIP